MDDVGLYAFYFSYKLVCCYARKKTMLVEPLSETDVPAYAYVGAYFNQFRSAIIGIIPVSDVAFATSSHHLFPNLLGNFTCRAPIRRSINLQ